MAVDVVTNLENALHDALTSGEILRRALGEEREMCQSLRADLFGVAAERDALRADLAAARAELAAAHASAAVTTAARPDPTAAHRTATAHVARLAAATCTAESTVRGNLTLSPTFGQLRDNAAAVDGVPLTQSERLLDWLSDVVDNGYGQYSTRYELLLRRQLSLESML